MNIAMPVKALITPAGVRPVREAFKFDDGAANVAETFARLGDLDDIELFYGQVLIAKFIRDKIGNLIAAPQTQMEDKWQGKVGLVLKVGPTAFVSGPGRDFGGASVKRGDWIIFRASDGNDVGLRCLDGVTNVECKILEDAECRGRCRFPDRLW